MAKQLILTTGNYGTLLRTTIKDDDNVVMNLTGCSVKGDLVKSDGSISQIDFSIADATNGVAQYQIQSSDTDVSGVVMIYISVIGGSFRITSNNTIVFVVIEADGGVV